MRILHLSMGQNFKNYFQGIYIMNRKMLYERIDSLESKLNHERTAHLQTQQRLAAAESDGFTKLSEWRDELGRNEKLAKEIKRLEAQNKKFMQAIDALKKQLADRTADRELSTREIALRFALSIAKSDEHIDHHAKLNYYFLTNTEPEEVAVDETLDLKLPYVPELPVVKEKDKK